jgi:excisionase family DNA binding protein
VPAQHSFVFLGVKKKPKSNDLVIDTALGIIGSISQHPHLLDAAELAEALNMSPKTIYAIAKSGTLPAVRIGQSIRFDPPAVAKWLRSNAA